MAVFKRHKKVKCNYETDILYGAFEKKDPC